MIKQLLTVLLLVLFAGCNSQESIKPLSADTIIPQPNEIVLGDGSFEINGATSLYCDNEVEGMVNYLQNYIPIKKR